MKVLLFLIVASAVAAGSYLAAALYMFFVQRSKLYCPDRSVPSRAEAELSDMDEVELTTEDGLRLAAWFRPARAGMPTVIYFHGNSGNRGWLGKKARPYLTAGYGLLLPDYRGFGGNPGTPSEDGLRADARAARRFLDQQGVAAGDVVYHGESLGSGVATYLASEQPPAALILEAAFESIPEVAKRKYPWLPTRVATRDRFTSIRRIRSIDIPLLVLHGEKDTLIPVEQGRALYEASPSRNKRLWTAPAGTHTDLFDCGAAEVILEFLSPFFGYRAVAE